MEAVVELEDPPEDPNQFYKRTNWAGVMLGTCFYKYRTPLDIRRTEEDVRIRKQQMLDPEFPKKLRKDIEEKKQNIKEWRLQLK